MPLKRCEETGWKWGDQGHCYHGPDAKKNALKQGYAIDPKHFKEEVSKGTIDVEGLTPIEQLQIALMARDDNA